VIEISFNTGNKPRVLLADGDAGTPALVSRVIASRCEMVGTVYDGSTAFAASVCLEPDVLIIDIILPKLNGFDVVRQLNAMDSNTKIVILTCVDEPDFIAEALRIGASGFVLKQKLQSDLPLAIQAALDGKKFVSTTPI
jgi:DNA-binding NarL/FixJ family response regulator